MFNSRAVFALFYVVRFCGARSMYHIPVFLSLAPSKDFDASVLYCNMSIQAVNMELY